MSRVGNAPIKLPKGVQLTAAGRAIKVKGPLGELESPLPAGVAFAEEGGVATLKRSGESRELRAMHGMARAILNNSVRGVSEGWERRLELTGVGYRVQLKGTELVFSLGYSHEVRYPLPKGIKAEVNDQTKLLLKGIDRQQIGQVGAEIRALRPPEPYKGKGIRYADEHVRRKAGKAGKAGKK